MSPPQNEVRALSNRSLSMNEGIDVSVVAADPRQRQLYPVCGCLPSAREEW
jgi:hypothetical protein